ncbi:hypothetical protein PLESTB_001421200 [Pleodorina starrii]|uniref:Uncharacterized protein n=1 Tax=Pleodorina starrii TaxID=330485 RepID=A0A9W6BWR0_9CHLO|nr:hypothetical protein PLESTB_001421200 [Pleodorina starrii]GLC65116.1 hypothetical protein PLESTF_000248300 [Pleodorina starrii]
MHSVVHVASIPSCTCAKCVAGQRYEALFLEDPGGGLLETWNLLQVLQQEPVAVRLVRLAPLQRGACAAGPLSAGQAVHHRLDMVPPRHEGREAELLRCPLLAKPKVAGPLPVRRACPALPSQHPPLSPHDSPLLPRHPPHHPMSPRRLHRQPPPLPPALRKGCHLPQRRGACFRWRQRRPPRVPPRRALPPGSGCCRQPPPRPPSGTAARADCPSTTMTPSGRPAARCSC